MLRSTIHLPPIEEGEFLLCYVKCCRGIRKVLESLFFRCIMFLSYRVTFLCNVLGQIHYTHGMKNMHTFFVSLSLKYPHIS